MKFRIEKNDIDFGSTHIDNIFIEDFMPVARGEYVKVYLYAYKNMMNQCETYELSNETLARNLQLTISDVENAWEYWENAGVIEKVYNLDGSYDIEFKNLKRYYIQSVKPKKSESQSEQLVKSINQTDIRIMLGEIDYYMRRQTTPVEKAEIISWIGDYNMSTDLITEAFRYSTEKKNKVSVNYIRAIILSWYDKKLFTIEEVEEEIKKSDSLYVRKKKVLEKLGLQYKMVSEEEIRMINDWYDKYDYPKSIIDEALTRTGQVNNPSIKYANAILDRWREKGITELKDIEKLDVKSKKRTVKKTDFHNFHGQSSDFTPDELDRIARDNRRRRK